MAKNTSLLLISLSICMLTSCTLQPLLCFLTFSDYTKTYHYSFSKEELKNRIVEVYSYNENLLIKNLGRTLIENEDVNKVYRTSINVWLDKSNWDEFKNKIRGNTPDTLNLIIGKHQSRKQIQFLTIIQGDENKSSVTINGFKYQQPRTCIKDKEYYRLRLSERIEKQFTSKIK